MPTSPSTLHRVLAVWHDAGLRPWLDQGALLGIVRSGDLIPWDPDIDFGAWEEDWQPVRDRVTDRLEAAGCRVLDGGCAVAILPPPGAADLAISLRLFRRGPDDHAHSAFYRLHSRRDEDPTALPLASRSRVRALATALTICKAARLRPAVPGDPWPTMLERIGQWGRRAPWDRALRVLERRLRGDLLHAGGTVPVRVPMRFLHDMELLEWRDFHFTVPSPLEEYLAFKYGPDWRTPRRTWDYLTQDGATARRST